MKGKEVTELLKPENQIELDADKSKQHLLTKMHLFLVAYHNIECSYLKDWGEESYGFIPFPCGSFADMLVEATLHFKMDTKKKFLDIGCGPGTKILMAKSFFDVFGIEIFDNFIQQAEKLGLKNKVFKADALEFEDYGKYDVLYFYRPFKDDKLQKKLEARVYSQMKPGAILAPMHTLTDWGSFPDIKKISDYLYLKEE